MEWLNISSVVAWSLATAVTIVLSVLGNLLTDPVRNRLAALSERRAKRRVAAILDRLSRIGMWRREPWRAQVYLFREMFQVVTMFSFAFLLLLPAIVRMARPSGATALDLVAYLFGNVVFLAASYAASRAQDTAGDMQFFVHRARKMVGTIEKLRRRYPALDVAYPNYSEVQEAVAEFQAEEPK
ncbi:MAG TPA: hypothetical protein VIL85_28525 [Thermomicrobiales bacterium]|jgi:hypothetical protein